MSNNNNHHYYITSSGGIKFCVYTRSNSVRAEYLNDMIFMCGVDRLRFFFHRNTFPFIIFFVCVSMCADMKNFICAMMCTCTSKERKNKREEIHVVVQNGSKENYLPNKSVQGLVRKKRENRDKFSPPLLLFTGLLLLAPVINFGIPSNITIRVCW